MYATIGLVIICLALAGLCGYLVYVADAARRKEAQRQYRFIDDMFDRIAAGDIERYAFTQRIKKELSPAPAADDQLAADAERAKTPKPFIHQGR